jgi:hypothetical protein
MKHEDLRSLVVNNALICPDCRRAVRILLGDDEGRLLCSLCFGRRARAIPM